MVRKVAVIGGGVIGITTAVVIAEHLDNVQVTVISDKWSPDTTGDGSAGYWAPYLLGDLPPDTLREWCKKSSEIFQEIFQSAKAVEYGVGLLPVYCIFSYAPTDDSVFNDLYLDYRPMTKKELSVFPSKYCYGISITSFFAECTKLLPALMKRIEKRDGRFIEKKIYSFSELAGKYDVVINCTGIGARNLVPDPEVTPIRGQVIKVRAPWMKHCVIIDDDYYVIPNSEEVVLGGTAQEGNWNLEVDPEDHRKIWENCTEALPCLKDAKILRDWVGLRPYRSTPRVERESIKTKKGNIDVIHNYGHGGSGVTVSWGCAFEVLGLLREALEDPYSSGFRSKM
ncbi:D-amino-acid oxidase-like [Argiope bruennichi]|uniref:D-amino-acid oxidase-like n=1 Tax=Argiope bruennichi TaxID=94029 RepID=UPI002495A31F|nr:D-amino-acid oxidase-like [Argiope bruennichi]XP_055936509.1 D-amino-acid oxidase-like [Argiope bruennichi]XP_055936511.1 D-amino-acid oxidase-like [Argiope bruennichi]